MRVFILMLLSAATAWPQLISVGVKGGIPFTDFLDSATSGHVSFDQTTNRYLVGPTAEVRLLGGFSLEVDALYRHFNYTGTNSATSTTTNLSTTGNSWEFPVLLKYRFSKAIVRPFVDGGVSFNTLSGLKQTVESTVSGKTTTTSSSNPAELQNNNTMGVVVGAGLDVHVLMLRISPEIRYTRWTNQQFLSSNGLLHSDLNQAEFLVGFTF